MKDKIILENILESDGNNFPQLSTYISKSHGIVWCNMHPEPRPCFNQTLIESLERWLRFVANEFDRGQYPINYQVIGSSVPGVFILGGDLNLLLDCIRNNDKETLYQYGLLSVDLLYKFAMHLNRPNLETICLVQGDALGGGFESALCANVLIAEQGSKFGFPDQLFNLFPGVGAITFLGRRIGYHKAEKMILSGKRFTTEELYEMDIIDVMAEPGQGVEAVLNYINKKNKMLNAAQGLREARELHDKISYENLVKVVEIWIERAFNLSPKDQRKIEIIVAKQEKINQNAA